MGDTGTVKHCCAVRLGGPSIVAEKPSVRKTMSKPPVLAPRAPLLARRLRVVTGLYLLGYVTCHLANLSLGLVSLEAMDAARPWLTGLWTTPLTAPVLLSALIVHYIAGLWSILTRPSLSGTTQDIVQALSGLAVVPLMAIHVVAVVMLQNVGVDVDYVLVSRIFWLSNPGYGLIQVLLLSVVWVHGCAGLFMWLRAKPSVVRTLPWLYPLAVAIPVLALLGYAQAGRTVLVEGLGPVIEQTRIPPGAPVPDVPYALIAIVTQIVLWGSLAISALVLLARGLRRAISQPDPVIIETRGVGRITGQTGQSLLDALRAQDQPHANLCNGRGRCGTCAVRVLATSLSLPPPTPLEKATLDRFHQGGDVRLACQLPLVEAGSLSVERLLPPDFNFDHHGPAPLIPTDAEAAA